MRNTKFKYIVPNPKNEGETELFQRIENSVNNLLHKLRNVNFEECGLSEYNQRYLKDYLDNFIYYAGLYTQVLITGIRNLMKPIEESAFIDYGGGSGFFSLLAKEFGFKTVIYNDIYDISVADAKNLAMQTGIHIDYFICGDIGDLVKELDAQNLKPGLICSFEVIEHIYNLEEWFKTAGKINADFSLVFSSSANIKNPHIVRRLKKAQIKAELKGTEKKWGSKQRDSARPFLEIRKEIISKEFPSLEKENIGKLAKRTRGLYKNDIIFTVNNYLEKGIPVEPIKHPTNTCDPRTGNWAEHLIDQNWLKSMARQNGFEHVEILPGFYTSSEKKFANLLKKLLNILIKTLGKPGLYFSPVYILKARKK